MTDMSDYSERDVSQKVFSRLTDQELFVLFKKRPAMTPSNTSAANRECRKRAKVEGFDGPYQWLKHYRAIFDVCEVA